MTSWPSVDHSLLSPSGRMSKRARRAALERTRRELFGDGITLRKLTPDVSAQAWRHRAAMFRDLAARGLKPRAHLKEAERCERLAIQAENT